jgi:hypothetical protein
MSANWAAWVVIVLLVAALAGSVVTARVRRRRHVDRGWHDAIGSAGLGPDRRRRSR